MDGHEGRTMEMRGARIEREKEMRTSTTALSAILPRAERKGDILEGWFGH